jgi:uncharacterized FlgJ-related protein
MKKILLILLILSASFASEQMKTQKIAIGSVDELFVLFDKLDYTREAWIKGDKSVPRIYFTKITKNWVETSQKMPVKKKKAIFFRLLAPSILMSNERILKDREKLTQISKTASKYTDTFVVTLAKKYRVIKKDEIKVTDEDIKELFVRVDKLPLSLALAQGASESGWATSRFALLGNSLFGQWDFSGNGIKPKEQRKELGNYGLAKFDTPQDSVDSYLRNINTHRSYELLRTMRAKNRDISGYKLAEGLINYSERREAYVNDIKSIIEFNKLKEVDDAQLYGNVKYYLSRTK